MMKLHEALVDILPEDQLSGVFAGIEEVLCQHIRQRLTKAGITNNGSTQHGYGYCSMYIHTYVYTCVLVYVQMCTYVQYVPYV